MSEPTSQGYVYSFLRGCFATATGATITVDSVLSRGSLLLAVVGSVIAIVGGLWTCRTARIKHEIAKLELEEKKQQAIFHQKDQS